MIRDHHKTIGVSENATQQEIKKAYKRKANKMHPDKGGDKNEFQALQEAYAVLSDPSKRKEYEETGEVKRAVNLEMQAYSGIAGIFSEIIDKNRHSIRRIDVVATAIKAVNTGICERHAEITQMSKTELEELNTRLMRDRDEIKEQQRAIISA